MGVESRIGMAGCRDGIIDSRSKLAHSSRLRTLGEYNLLGQRQSDSRAVPEDIDRSPCWIVYCKEIVQGSDRVLEYLGRYVHRTAISNRAVVSCTDRSVTFRYRSHRDDKTKLMTLSPDEFLRRFLQHVLPRGFHRVRSFGLLHPKHRTTLRRRQLMLCRSRNHGLATTSRSGQSSTLRRCPVCNAIALRPGPPIPRTDLAIQLPPAATDN